MTIASTSNTTRYKCTVTRQRGCRPGSKGNHIEKTCEECNCYTFPGVRSTQCFNRGGGAVDAAEFPFLSVNECAASCKDESCIPTGKDTSRYACQCIDAEPCIEIGLFKKNCNCVACYCDLDGEGNEVCRDNKGKTILGDQCLQSLQQCVGSCRDYGCPTTTKWGCLEAEGAKCAETNEVERITDCVELGCKEVNGLLECTPLTNSVVTGDGTLLTNSKLVSANFNTRGECEKDRLSPFGSCKSRLCANSSTNIRGVSTAAASLYHAVPPTNLGVRAINILNVNHLATYRINAGKAIDDLEDDSIYNAKFNFATHGFPKPPTKLISNSKYLDTFNNYVSIVVHYFLDREGSEDGWNETFINELMTNTDHIAQSLNTDLNLIFNNLTYPTGIKVDPNDLYSGIIELLLTGSMNEFDPHYFMEVYKGQSDVKIDDYRKSEDTRTNDNVALGIISESLIPADPKKHTDKGRHFDFIANTKPFLTDIKANIPIIIGDDSSSSAPLELADLGIPVVFEGDVITHLDPGEGFGNYFTLSSSITNEQYVLEVESELSSAYLTPIDALAQAAKLLGKDSNMKITASSAGIAEDGHVYPSEFDSDFTIPSSTDFTYFALDLSAITSNTSPDNHIINELKCPYKVMTSSSEITAHSIEAGTQITEVFLHYNDPIRTYLKDSGYCELDLINIDFSSFVDGKAPLHGEIIVRGNIPKALVFIPAIGSRYNPFHAKSKIDNIDYAETAVTPFIRVSRGCEFVPYLETQSAKHSKHASTRKFTYEEYGTYGRGSLGTLRENHPLGTFDVDSSFFTYELSGNEEYSNLFYNSSSYSSSAPDIELPPTTVAVSGVIGDLKNKYNYTHFTWWDIFRRLKLRDYAALQLEMNKVIIKALENGVVTGGDKVSMVLSGPNESNTGLRHPSDDTTYLTEDDRIELLADGTITEDVTYLSEGSRGG